MRFFFRGSVAALAIALPACGGGGSSGGGTGTSLALQGLVVSRDGSATNLGGIGITCIETGQTATTTVGGSFALDVPAGVIHLEVVGSASGGADDCSESGDGDTDESDISGSQVEIAALGDGETCGVEVEIADGRIVGVRVTIVGDGADLRKEFGEGVLSPPHASDSHAYGEVEVADREHCSHIEFEVRGLAAGSWSIVLIAADGAEETVGTFSISDFSGFEGHFAIESCEDDRRLPFGVATAATLAGYGVEIRDGEGAVALFGLVPGVGADDVTHDHDKDDDGHEDVDHHDGDHHHGEHHASEHHAGEHVGGHHASEHGTEGD